MPSLVRCADENGSGRSVRVCRLSPSFLRSFLCTIRRIPLHQTHIVPMKIAAIFALCFVFLAINISSASAGEIECGVCTYLVGAVEHYVADNKTESEILTLISNDCSVLHVASWVSVCKGTVLAFGPEIINLVLEKQPAAVICNEIKMCNSSAIPAKFFPAPPAPKKLSGNNTLECELCQFLVHEIENLVSQNKTETEILAGLTNVCKAFPVQSWQTACAGVVQEYGAAIIQYVINEDPKSACHAVGNICPAPSVKFSSPATIINW